MNKLYILRPKEGLPEQDNPWEPWYDKCFGMVVCASDENEARVIANKNSGDENRGEFMQKKIADTVTPWLDAKYSTCKILDGLFPKGVVIKDEHYA